MTATERLRSMLDERGVGHSGGDTVVYFMDERGYKACAYDAPKRYGDGALCVCHTATPEQAIAATLGDDEASRLRSCMAADADAHKELLAENEKLRELVRDMFACISHANEADWFYFERDKTGCGMSCTVNGEECGLLALSKRMRELGVEV